MSFNYITGILKYSFKIVLAYRLSMWFSFFTFPIVFMINYFLWTSIFQATGSDTIGGFTLTQMISYYIISLLSMAFMWNHVIDEVHRGVREGEFTNYLVKPINYPVFAFIFNINSRFLSIFFEFIPMIVLIGVLFGFEFLMTNNTLLFIIALTLGFIINFLISLIIATLIFWFTNPNGINWIYRIFKFVLAGGIIPLTFFPVIVQKISLYLPFAYINFIPVTIFTGNLNFAGIELGYHNIILFGLLQIIVLSLFFWYLWKKALKKYQGVGM